MLFISLFLLITSALSAKQTLQVLPNKAVIYTQEELKSKDLGRLQVTVDKRLQPSYAHTFDFSPANLEDIEPFLADCAAGIGPSCEGLNLIAVGDFSSEDMQNLFAHHFSHIQIEKPYSLKKTSPSFKGMGLFSSTEPFYEMPLLDWEMKTIHKIISSMAEKNVFQLALEKKTIEKKGKKIRHVHPLRFIGYIFGDAHLKRCMHEIKKSFFKWHSFIEGFSDKMKEEHRDDNLERYVPGFAESLGVSSTKVMQYIDDKDWEELVKFLL